jgi:hypothetical protein
VRFSAFLTQKNSSLITPGFLPIRLKIAGSQPTASICCESHEGPPLSFMASDGEPKNIFRSTALVGEFWSILDSKINYLLRMVSCLQVCIFQLKPQKCTCCLFAVLLLQPSQPFHFSLSSLLGCGYKPGSV